MSGGRIVLKLRERSSEFVRYDALLESANEHLKTLATVRMEDGAVSFDAWEPREPPTWLVDSTRALLRTEWRAQSWPRRISRWRAAK